MALTADDLQTYLDEPRQQRAFAALVRPGDIVYDLGAHHGFYTVLAARLVGPRGRVVACEPQARNCAEIRRNLALNGFAERCAVVEAAVGDREGVADFQTVTDPSPTGTLVGKLATARGTHDWTPAEVASTFAVPSFAVDGLAGQFGLPAVVKCDVEGAESMVLRGADGILRADPDGLAVIGPQRRRGGGVRGDPHAARLPLRSGR